MGGAYGDLPYSVGMGSLWNAGMKDQFFFSWRISFYAAGGSIIENLLAPSTEGMALCWEALGNGLSIERAFQKVERDGGIYVANSWWGKNGIMDLAVRDPDDDTIIDNLVVWGSPLLNQIKLE